VPPFLPSVHHHSWTLTAILFVFFPHTAVHIKDPYRRVHFIVPDLAGFEVGERGRITFLRVALTPVSLFVKQLKPYVSYKATRAPTPEALDAARLLLAATAPKEQPKL
jgi:hypothetical protein